VVKSHIADKSLKRIKQNLTEQAKNVAKPRTSELQEISLYNEKVKGIQEYYNIATEVNLDCAALNRAVMTIFTNRLGGQKGKRLVRKGRELTKYERDKYGKSVMLRFVAGSNEPIYPIGYVQHKKPMAKKRSANPYSADGRIGVHDNLSINTALMRSMMEQPLNGRSVEYADNRISMFSAQMGKCLITGTEFMALDEIHCHHITPRSNGGTDQYHNLILVLPQVHRLIHATQEDTIAYYLKALNLRKKQLEKLNKYREKAGNAKI
jgi:5-methylcytosine-specific restriction endonuclease McrA